MNTTATLVHTSSTAAENALRIARVAAAGRIAAARLLAERERTARLDRALASATSFVEDARAAGAVEVGCKIWLEEGGKWRTRVSLEDAAWFIARTLVNEEDIEAWGLTASGEYAEQF